MKVRIRLCSGLKGTEYKQWKEADYGQIEHDLIELVKKQPKSGEVEVAQKRKKNKLCLDFDESEDEDEEKEDDLSSLVEIKENIPTSAGL